jgi:hypothetical protein
MTDRAPLPYDFMSAVPSFELRSDDVADGQMMSQKQVFDGFGMTGRNISPSQPGRLASWASSHGEMSARWRLSGEVCAG